MGLQSNNDLRYVNVSKMYLKLGPTLSKALPGLHARTSSDYTAAFSRKGKIKPFVQLEKNIEAQRAFGALGVSEEVTPDFF